MKLSGEVALVTAAGRGIGRGIALALGAAGARVVVNSYSEHTTISTVEAIVAAGGEALACPGDITLPEVMIDTRDQALRKWGQLDILVNNVGAAPKANEEPAQHELGVPALMWNGLYGQNLLPAVLMTEAVLQHMRGRRSGKIVNISSIAGKTSLSDQMLQFFLHPAYSAMKAALISYTHTQAEMLGPYNINVNAVCPGIVYTDAWKSNAERAVTHLDEFKGQDPRLWFEGIARGDYPHIFDRTPLRREQTVEDIANAVVFLASSAAENITGQSLMVDGGMVKL